MENLFWFCLGVTIMDTYFLVANPENIKINLLGVLSGLVGMLGAAFSLGWI